MKPTKPAELTRRQRRVIQRNHRWHDVRGTDYMGRPIHSGTPVERRAFRTQKRERWL